MGRKSSAEIGPVHSPIGRHDAKRTRKNPTKSQKSKQNKTKHKTNKTATKTPDSTVAKDNGFLHYQMDWYGEKTNDKKERNTQHKIAIQEM
jgi:hypothetical protein